MKYASNWVTGIARGKRAALIAIAFIAVGAFALMPLIANPGGTPREIVLVTRDMAFFIEGSDVPNPTIVLKAAEEVRITIKNQEPGITHAFAAPDVSLNRIEPGATRRLSLRAPAEPGRYEYVCPPHAQMMKGVLLVTSGSGI